MKTIAYNAVRGIVRIWVSLYTTGLPRDIRDSRRAEIESDMWEQRAHDEAVGKGRTSAWRLAMRSLGGIAADLLWRLETSESQGATQMLHVVMSPRAYLNYIVFFATAMVLFPIGIGTFIAGLVCVAVPFAMMATPFMYQRGDYIINFGLLRIDALPETVLVAIAGVVLFTIELLCVNALFRLLRGKIALRIGSLHFGEESAGNRQPFDH